MISIASAVPSMSAAVRARPPRGTWPRPRAGRSPGPEPRHGEHQASAAAARAAGSAVSHSGWSAVKIITAPSTATATKLTEDLMSRNATERRAILSAGIPPRLSTQAPSATPAAPLAGTIDPTASSDPAISQLVRQPMARQKIGRNISTYEAQLRSSNTTAIAIQPGAARVRRSRTSLSPGVRTAIRTRTTTSAKTCSARRPSRAGATSSGSA